MDVNLNDVNRASHCISGYRYLFYSVRCMASTEVFFFFLRLESERNPIIEADVFLFFTMILTLYKAQEPPTVEDYTVRGRVYRDS